MIEVSFGLVHGIYFLLLSYGLTQSSTSPEYWFLSHTEILNARGGHPRKNMHTWSEGNIIMSVGGAALSTLIYNIMSDVQQGDVYRSATWCTGPNFLLRPDINEDSSLGSILINASRHGANVSEMVWYGNPLIYNKLETNFSKEFVNQINKYGKNAYAIRDDRSGWFVGSIHQKTFIMKTQQSKSTVACLGGIDLAGGRWDVPGQNTSYPKCQTSEQCKIQKRNFDFRLRAQGDYPGLPAEHGWRDLSVCFEGPAINDVDISFTNRWNNKQKGSLINPCKVKPGQPNPISPLPESHKVPGGSIAIQILETYLCDYPCYVDIAPLGDISPLHALLKAISLAESFVYIEDQYGFLVESVQEELIKFLNRQPQGVVIFLIQYPQDSTVFTYWFYQMWHPLYLQYPDRIRAYFRKGDIYVHTKLRIVDDIWSFVGSQNFNRRSYSYDSEIGVAVIDQNIKESQGRNVGSFVHNMRTQAFEEHTGVFAHEWETMNINDVIHRLDKIAASSDQSKIGNYVVEIFNVTYTKPWWTSGFLGRLIRYVADPDGRCDAYVDLDCSRDCLDQLIKDLNRMLEKLYTIDRTHKFITKISNVLQKLKAGLNLCAIFTPALNRMPYCSQVLNH